MRKETYRSTFIKQLTNLQVPKKEAEAEWKRLLEATRYRIKKGKIITDNISKEAFNMFSQRGRDIERLGGLYIVDDYEETGDKEFDRFNRFRNKYKDTSIEIYFQLYEEGKISIQELGHRVDEFKKSNASYQGAEGSK